MSVTAYRDSWYKVLGFPSARRRAQNVGLVQAILLDVFMYTFCVHLVFGSEPVSTGKVHGENRTLSATVENGTLVT